ncbi:MAG: hypothetical protein Kow0098_03950 [Ignavibacteriaceae bacterium]
MFAEIEFNTSVVIKEEKRLERTMRIPEVVKQHCLISNSKKQNNFIARNILSLKRKIMRGFELKCKKCGSEFEIFHLVPDQTAVQVFVY